MVALSEVIASNERINASFPAGLVAVFIGGTSGVGEYTVKAFAKHVSKPKAYIVGRSQESADRILGELKQINSNGVFEFIRADVSGLKNVDDVCHQIRSKESAIDILMLTSGSMGFTKTTPDGLPLASALAMHSRTRFILNLLPLLQNATSLRRVVSVLAATYEGPIDMNNILGQGYGLMQWRDHIASVQTMLLEGATRRAPDVAFVHDVPGVVKGGIMRDSQPGFGLKLMIGITNLLAPIINTPPEESGERHLWEATSARFAPRKDTAGVAGVPLRGGVTVARGSDGKIGSGIYTIDNKGESSPPKVEKLLAKYREDGTTEKVWEYVMADFKRITGIESAQ